MFALWLNLEVCICIKPGSSSTLVPMSIIAEQWRSNESANSFIFSPPFGGSLARIPLDLSEEVRFSSNSHISYRINLPTFLSRSTPQSTHLSITEAGAPQAERNRLIAFLNISPFDSMDWSKQAMDMEGFVWFDGAKNRLNVGVVRKC